MNRHRHGIGLFFTVSGTQGQGFRMHFALVHGQLLQWFFELEKPVFLVLIINFRCCAVLPRRQGTDKNT